MHIIEESYFCLLYTSDLEGIDFSRLPELQQLNIQGYASDDGETDSTTISSLDLSKCAKLKILDIRNAYFTKNLGSSLNINGCTSLDTLYIKDSKNLGTDAANPFISLGNCLLYTSILILPRILLLQML